MSVGSTVPIRDWIVLISDWTIDQQSEQDFVAGANAAPYRLNCALLAPHRPCDLGRPRQSNQQ